MKRYKPKVGESTAAAERLADYKGEVLTYPNVFFYTPLGADV